MSQQIEVLDITFTAGEDLRTAQYKAVYLSADQTVSLCTTGHLDAIGILQNEPNLGEEATVRVLGTSKAIASEAITFGTRVVVGTDGLLDAIAAISTTEQRVFGIALETSSSTSGDIIEIFLMHFSFVKGSD